MGGCLSTTNPPSEPHRNTENTPQNTHISKSSLLEEETIKEVLTETPSGRVQPISQSDRPFIKNAPLLLRDFSRKNPNALRDHRNGVVFKKSFGADDSVSEDLVSEICTTLGESESVSVSTAVTDDLPRHRSPAKRKTASFPGEARKDGTVGRSPGRRPEPSPNRDRPGPGNVRRRDGGDSSARRSRSPVTRADPGNPKTGPGRSNSASRAAKSPGRVGSGLGERTRRVDGERKAATTIAHRRATSHSKTHLCPWNASSSCSGRGCNFKAALGLLLSFRNIASLLLEVEKRSTISLEAE